MVALIPAIAFLVICAVAAIRESSVTAPYHYLKIYGRFTAYLAMDLTMCGLFIFGGSVISPFLSAGMDSYGYLGILGGAVMFGCGCMMYYTAYLKCPEGMRKHVVFDMLITGFGVTVKICLFFFKGLWRYADANTFTRCPQTLTSGGLDYKLIDSYGSTAVYEDQYGKRHVFENMDKTFGVFTAQEIGGN